MHYRMYGIGNIWKIIPSNVDERLISDWDDAWGNISPRTATCLKSVYSYLANRYRLSSMYIERNIRPGSINNSVWIYGINTNGTLKVKASFNLARN